MKFFMILLTACKLYSSDNNQISKHEFIRCIILFKECNMEHTETFKAVIAANQAVYDKYMKQKHVTFSEKDDICQL